MAKYAFDHAEAVKLFATGLYTYTSLAEQLNVSEDAIRRVISRQAPHLKPGRKHPILTFDRDEAIRLFATGAYTFDSLAQELGVTKYAISGTIYRRAPHLKQGCGHRPLTFDHNEAIRLFATRQYTYSSLAEKLGVSASAINGVIRKKAPHLQPGNWHKVRSFDYDEAVKLYATGDYTYGSLGKKLGVSAGVIFVAIDKTAPHLKPGCCVPEQRSFDHTEAIRLFATGQYTYAEVGKKLGVSASAINGVIRKKVPHLLPGNWHVSRSFDHDEAIRLFATGRYTYNSLGKELGVDGRAISAIIHEKAHDIISTNLKRNFKIAGDKARTIHDINRVKEIQNAA